MIRPAIASDIKQLFLWRNLKEAVELSSSRKTVTWAEHQSWFNYAVRGIDTLVFIIEPSAGNVRLNKIDDEAYISITVLPEHRGKGLGVCAINDAIREMRKRWEVKRVTAYIREDNERSINVFTKCGFIADGGTDCPEGHIRMMSL